MNAIILIKLIAAHLIGDFVLQSDKMCVDKFSSDTSAKYKALVLHALVHATLAYVFVADWNCWLTPVVIGISHFIIDFVKTLSGRNDFVGFLWDQAVHYCVIIGLSWFMFAKAPQTDLANGIVCMNFWLIATAYVAVLAPTSILIKYFVEYERWLPSDDASQGLPNAGKWIGYLERILILTFIFTNTIEGIGFLLAAKSVFRFGELNRAKDIKITEYVLIGTFASFTIAILIGFGINRLLGI